MATVEKAFILPLNEQVVFPGLRASIQIPAETWVQIDKANVMNIGVVATKPGEPGNTDLYTTGTWCRKASATQSTTKAKGREVTIVTLTLEGVTRFQVQRFTQTSPYRLATIKLVEDRETDTSPQMQELMKQVQDKIIDLSQQFSPGIKNSPLDPIFGRNKMRWPSSPSLLADMVAAGLSQLSVVERQQVLEALDVKKRMQLVLDLISKVAEVQRLSNEISSRMQRRSEDERDQLRETVLRRQLSEAQKEMKKLRKGGKSDGDGEEIGEDLEEPEQEGDEEEDEIAALQEALRKAQLSPDAQKIAQRELRRLQNIQPQHPEYNVSRTYLETLSQLPWATSTDSDLDLGKAFDVLEEDHYGLDKVKRRILEFLAVQKMRGDMKGPILCLHGPPGVGKTSLGRSVARALGRKFHRIALGGVRDEAELRGHRRTYIGSMPGAIIQALMTLKVNNPVILLDEIDKLTRNAMFNPSGAMLELLDPEQNHTFKDHYLNTPFDLSKVLFLCTCNNLNTIDRPLLDRMEVIELAGYTSEEKQHIALKHILPKQRRLHALERGADEDEAKDREDDMTEALDPESQRPEAEESGATSPDMATQAPRPDECFLEITPAAITELVTKWTMESGVRSLERRIAQVCRWAALRINGIDGRSSGAASEPGGGSDSSVLGGQRSSASALADCGPDEHGRLHVDARHLPHILGAEMFEPDIAERLTVGVAMGLGVTSTGGQLLFVEATRSKGSGRLTVTGQLGDVMRESVSTAMSLLRSKIYYAILATTGEARPIVRVGDSESVAALAEAHLPCDGTESPVEPSNSKFHEVFHHVIAHASPSKDPFGEDDVHVHFPAGAIPKDGPSAGVTTTLALASLLLNRPVRSDTAVTGEITLRGHILPVGGIRDKVLAAHRSGVRHVLLPYANRRHAKDELPPSAVGDVELHFVRHIDDALAWAFADGAQAWAAEVSPSGGAPSPTLGFSLLAKL
mmetsp:Transcript_113803/g.328650  ORF Transcript_113803/g.328650 Transcript_113803/m.328650 type:complete len:972 (-) Transcript_113803:96-3011(-)|eukprot:CAMPEP_0176043162 /NCGR_PEP_ID=MMETSP0120_2-20121206/21418_1 /TAXON_ID=160619 /ORGANISM="Kryptoperidinium foliaceum, Strain CCMP 1326" /LENGTH=971 /DNA_ID=CAMNT_0017376569 /DNA_START=149 /DNA_END=3064 /DNA_ORIENTATION=+